MKFAPVPQNENPYGLVFERSDDGRFEILIGYNADQTRYFMLNDAHTDTTTYHHSATDARRIARRIARTR